MKKISLLVALLFVGASLFAQKSSITDAALKYKKYNPMKSYISDDYYGVLQSKYNNARNRILNNNIQLNSVGINTNEPPEHLNKAYRYIYSSSIVNSNQVFIIFFVLISCLALFFFLV
jgi:hypothetical protein